MRHPIALLQALFGHFHLGHSRDDPNVGLPGDSTWFMDESGRAWYGPYPYLPDTAINEVTYIRNSASPTIRWSTTVHTMEY